MAAETYDAISANFIPQDTPAETPTQTPSEAPPVEEASTEASPVEEVPTPVEESATEAAPVEDAAADSAESQEPSDDELGGDDATEQAVADAAGISVKDLAEEFTSNQGQWSEETTAKLVTAVEQLLGTDSEEATQLVQDFAEGKRAQAKLAALDLYSVIGGEDKYPAIQQWARATLTPDEIAAHDRAVQNAQTANDLEGMKDALRSLKAKYDTHVGTARTVVESDGSPTSNEPPIMSVQELATIQASTEYKADPNYRDRVAARVRAGMATGQYRH